MGAISNAKGTTTGRVDMSPHHDLATARPAVEESGCCFTAVLTMIWRSLDLFCMSSYATLTNSISHGRVISRCSPLAPELPPAASLELLAEDPELGELTACNDSGRCNCRLEGWGAGLSDQRATSEGSQRQGLAGAMCGSWLRERLSYEATRRP